MRSANLSISKKKHVNLSIRSVPESPLFLIPTLYWLPKHDVNLEIEGYSFGFCFLRMVGQLNIRQNAWRKRSSTMDLVRSNALASTMRDELSSAPDALAIMKSFDKNRWLKELSSRGVDDTHYGIRIIKEAAKEEMVRREIQAQQQFDTKSSSHGASLNPTSTGSTKRTKRTKRTERTERLVRLLHVSPRKANFSPRGKSQPPCLATGLDAPLTHQLYSPNPPSLALIPTPFSSHTLRLTRPWTAKK
jgi:hypothetical protein